MVRWWCCPGGCTVPFALCLWGLLDFTARSASKNGRRNFVTNGKTSAAAGIRVHSRDLGDRLAKTLRVSSAWREQRINGCETATVCLNGPLFHVNVQRCKSLPNDLPAHRQSDAATYASSTGRRNDSAWFLGGPRERLLHVAAKGKTGYKIKDAAGTQIGERAV